MKLLKGRRDLSFLFVSILISQLGTWFTYMLFIVRIFNETENEAYTMLIVGAEAIAGLIGGQVAGMIVEKRKPKSVLMASDWMSAAVIASVFFVPVDAFWYSGFAFLIAFVSAFRMPAFEKYLVAAVSEKELMQANSTFRMAREIIKIVGPALAVPVLALLPLSLKNLGFLADSFSYVISALLLIGLIDANKRFGASKEEDPETSESEVKLSWIARWKEGATPLKDPIMFNVFAILLLMLFGIAGADVVLTAHIHEAGLNTYDFGYVIGALSLGIIITTAFGAKYVQRLPLTAQLGLSGLFLGVCYGMVGVERNLWMMMVAAFLMGIFNGVYNMSSTTFWQKSVPYNKLGRFFGFVGSLASLFTLIGMAANAYISTTFSASLDIILCGSVIAFAGVILVLNLSIMQKKKAIRKNQSETA
ncbi:MAG TPA: MFS transporter [Bacillales bacterium]|nr:MFS transporter [Bacillales bacterium]